MLPAFGPIRLAQGRLAGVPTEEANARIADVARVHLDEEPAMALAADQGATVPGQATPADANSPVTDERRAP